MQHFSGSDPLSFKSCSGSPIYKATLTQIHTLIHAHKTNKHLHGWAFINFVTLSQSHTHIHKHFLLSHCTTVVPKASAPSRPTHTVNPSVLHRRPSEVTSPPPPHPALMGLQEHSGTKTHTYIHTFPRHLKDPHQQIAQPQTSIWPPITHTQPHTHTHSNTKPLINHLPCPSPMATPCVQSNSPPHYSLLPSSLCLSWDFFNQSLRPIA